MLGKFIEFWVIQQWLTENEALISMMRFAFIGRHAPGFGPFTLGAIKERIEFIDFAVIQAVVENNKTIVRKKLIGLFCPGLIFCIKMLITAHRDFTKSLIGYFGVAGDVFWA